MYFRTFHLQIKNHSTFSPIEQDVLPKSSAVVGPFPVYVIMHRVSEVALNSFLQDLFYLPNLESE
jgi:hypothetical protein